MGNSAGIQTGSLSKQETGKLLRYFSRLAPGTNRVRISQLLQLVEFGCNPLAPFCLQLFDTDGSGDLSFDEFARAVEFLVKLRTDEAIYSFAFDVFSNGCGELAARDLFNLLKHILQSSCSDAQLEHVVQRTMAIYDQDGDGALSLQEFKELVSQEDLFNRFALRL